MPAMANITVKKNDGTTDVAYTAVAASGGDKSPAVWRNNTVGSAAAHRPQLKMTSQSNQDGTTRRMRYDFAYPELVTDENNVTTVLNKFTFSVDVGVPQGMDETALNEGVSQGFNLVASTLSKDSSKAGYAPA